MEVYNMSNINVNIPISLELVNKLSQLAKEENRELDNFIINELQKIIDTEQPMPKGNIRKLKKTIDISKMFN